MNIQWLVLVIVLANTTTIEARMSQRGIPEATDGALNWVLDFEDDASCLEAYGVDAKEPRSELDDAVAEEDEGGAGALG